MSTHRDIASTETDPQAPITAALMKALDDNLDAAFQGDPTAIAAGVRLWPTALVDLAGNGRVEHTGTTALALALPYPSTWLAMDLWAQNPGVSTANFRFRSSSDGGATWGSYLTVMAVSAGGIQGGRLFLRRTDGAIDFRSFAGARSTPTLSVAADMNALEFSFDTATGSPIGRHFVTYMGGAG